MLGSGLCSQAGKWSKKLRSVTLLGSGCFGDGRWGAGLLLLLLLLLPQCFVGLLSEDIFICFTRDLPVHCYNHWLPYSCCPAACLLACVPSSWAQTLVGTV
jgi:hypothetical protein